MSVLFQPARVGSLEVQNRFIRSATYEGMGDGQGGATSDAVKLYEMLGRGGIGTVITGYMFVCDEGKPTPIAVGIHQDRLLPGLESLAGAIKAHGTRAIFQVAHAGTQTSKKFTGSRTRGPGDRRDMVFMEKVAPLTRDEIRQVVRDFAKAARRAQQAGADGVQIHAAHGYLLSEFLSPFYNQRSDAYGGGEEGRYRIVGEIIASIREEVGEDFPLLVKMNLDDGTPEKGVTPSLATEYAARMAADGVDLIETSAGGFWAPFMMTRGEVHVEDFVRSIPWPIRPVIARRMRRSPQPPFQEGWNSEAARLIKEAVGEVPVAVVGGMRTVPAMEEIISSGGADFVSMCRPLIRQPALIRMFEEDPATVPSCISCSRCLAACFNGLSLRCYVKGLPA